MITKAEANERLSAKYGKYEDGEPRFRVSWTTEEVEKRQGRHEIWYKGLYVKEEYGVREWPKYSFAPDRWVLEMRVPRMNPELVEPHLYEPIFFLQDKNGDYLPLNWDVLCIVIDSLANRERPKVMGWKEELSKEDDVFRKEVARNKEILKKHSRDNMDWKWADKEAVFIPSQQTMSESSGEK